MNENPEQHDHDQTSEVWPDRRSFLKKAAAVTAFSAPIVASYDLGSLGAHAAQVLSSNMSNTTFQ